MNTLKSNEFELYSIPELCNKNYFIPDYQRGYRWGTKQVEQLLDDLHTFFSNVSQGFYCLQPIVVKELTEKEIEKHKLQSDFDDNRWYEVIDGQQRLTTIRIIIAIMNLLIGEDYGDFNIYYQTRPYLKDVFKSLKRSDDKQSIELEKYGDGEELDIDAWCVLHAANVIHSFPKFTKDKYRSFKGTFTQYFLNDGTDKNNPLVKVIWYELKDGSEARDLFDRLNNNKIALTNSELIRAMFLSDSSDYGCSDDEKMRKQMHIVEKWDEIEHKLRDDKFWSYITNRDSVEYSNRIELLFDFISKKYTKKDENEKISREDPQYTFLYFDSLFKNENNETFNLWELWMLIEKYYSIIVFWYEDFNFYHKIGYLILMNDKDIIPELIEKYKEMNKREFEEEVIDKEIKKIADVDLNVINYEENYKTIKQLLTLYNVELCRNKEKQAYGRFPFDKFKAEDWTLEHIHAQNSQGINKTKKDAWYKWLEENIKMLERLEANFNGENKDDIANLRYKLENNCYKDSEKKSYNEKISYKEIECLFNEVLAFFDKLSKINNSNKDKETTESNDSPEVHQLSNMTLLSGKVNTAVGNMVFEGKRQLIVLLDSTGKEYIPIGTKRVFLKYHNINEDAASVVQQMYFWGEKDRENYMADIRKTLKPYLNPDKI